MLKQRAIIQFCVGLGHTQAQTMKMLNRSTIKRIFWYTKEDISGTVNTGNNNGPWQMWPSLVKI